MNKKQLEKLLLETIYLTLALIGFIGSFGYFKRQLAEIYIYFTNLSNYLCMGIILARFISHIKAILRNEEYESQPSLVSTLAAVYILITMIVYNVLLAPADGLVNYLFNFQAINMHIVLPILYLVYWFKFEDKSKVNFKNCQLVVIFPLVYVAYILIRSRFLVGTDTKLLIYPYFFLNIEKIGIGMVMAYLVGLLVIFLCLTNIGTLIIRKEVKKKEN